MFSSPSMAIPNGESVGSFILILESTKVPNLAKYLLVPLTFCSKKIENY